MAVLNMVEAIRATLHAEMERDERIILLGQDIGRNGGMFRATDGLQQRFGEARVVDMPLAEGVIVGSAVGLAINMISCLWPEISSGSGCGMPPMRTVVLEIRTPVCGISVMWSVTVRSGLTSKLAISIARTPEKICG